MTGEFQEKMDRFWQESDTEALRSKDSQYVQERLARWISNLSPSEREQADEILISWIHSGDSQRQFDALSLISELGVTAAIPELRVLAMEFEQSDKPSAPYDWAWVNRIIGRLREST